MEQRDSEEGEGEIEEGEGAKEEGEGEKEEGEGEKEEGAYIVGESGGILFKSPRGFVAAADTLRRNGGGSYAIYDIFLSRSSHLYPSRPLPLSLSLSL